MAVGRESGRMRTESGSVGGRVQMLFNAIVCHRRMIRTLTVSVECSCAKSSSALPRAVH